MPFSAKIWRHKFPSSSLSTVDTIRFARYQTEFSVQFCLSHKRRCQVYSKALPATLRCLILTIFIGNYEDAMSLFPRVISPHQQIFRILGP